ncbi:C4-dicarboxylate transporter DcuC [Thermophilibacter immobilis]|uniref:C4-dicarboxylate transporter DcuC n=1 Tax=Thermophilibacter immobilis TaxID=2779519 RepID=UPI001E592A73|nr:C4-dicarboxylate transporter DcuC [Thermophilibacter immobilis]
MEILAVILTLAYIFFVSYLVIKQYNVVFVFMSSGIAVLLLCALLTGQSVLDADKSTGNLLIDVFQFVENEFNSNTAGTGITLMVVSGYAAYMSHIRASNKLAKIVVGPLSKLRSPYLVAALLFVIDSYMKTIISSHSALGILLMAIAFPILVELGLSRLSAAAIVVIGGFIDWGPSSPSAIFASSKVLGISPTEFFLQDQLLPGTVLVLVAAIFTALYFRYLDRKASGGSDSKLGVDKVAPAETVPSCPTWYALFPVLPLVLIIVFSVLPVFKLQVVSAFLLSLMVVFVIELVRSSNKKATTGDFKIVMSAMGKSFTNVVTIIIGASVFVKAIESLGGITIISNALASANIPILASTLMSLITFLAGIVLGSGIASWYGFGPLVPDIATKMGISTLSIALPMEIASGIGRCMSPVAAVMIAVAGMGGVKLMDLVRRCAVPCVVIFIANLIICAIFTLV